MPDSFLKYLARNPNLRNSSPAWIRKVARRIFPLNRYNKYLWAEENPYIGTDKEWNYRGQTDNTVAIIFDPAHYHKYFMTACLDIGVSYVVIDIRSNDWLKKLQDSRCTAVLLWPLITNIVLKEMIDERLRLIENELNLYVYPSSNEVWLLDNKRRVSDWLNVNDIEQPLTDSFFIEEEAIDFANNTSYPIVFKTVRGSVSHGVMILRSREQAIRIIKKAFSRGIVHERSDPRNFQWDFVLFQEYLPEVEEKRMIRIGDSFICIDKVRKGDFHSGSGYMKWGDPGEKFLPLTKQITDKGNFRSMNVDFFISNDDRILVNELHTLFHGPVIPDSEKKGRYLISQDKWIFESGNFYRNYCCNLRVLDLMNILKEQNLPDRFNWLSKPAF